MKKNLLSSVSYLTEQEPQWKETRSSRMADDPPYLTVGTEVSAKYKGAFCEAKIRKVVRVVKCKVTFRAGNGSFLLSDDQIKGALRIGANVEAKHPDKSQFIEATINKIQDCSQYTVVFDDGDITTLRRSALCLKSGRHFNESETLDQLPLTHPEHFSNPVVGGRRGVRRRAADSSDEEDEVSSPSKKDGKKKYEREWDMGKVVCVESTDKKKSKDTWFPALVVSPAAQETVKIRIKDEYLVRSFRDGRYYTVPKKEITEFTKDSKSSKYDSNSNVLRSAVEKASSYLEKNELPPHWDREALFGNARQSESGGEEEEQQSESEPEDDPRNEEKDRFIAQLYKFMDDRSTPLNKVPQVCNKDLDLHKLFKIVTGKGGYTKVTNQGQWKSATIKLGYGNMPSTSTINLVKQAYKKFLFNFEEFYRKLGCTWTPRSSVSTSSKSRSSRSIFRERGRPAASSSRETVRDKKEADEEDGRATPSSSKRETVKDKAEKSSPEEKEKPTISSPEVDSPAAGDTGSETSEVKPKVEPPEEVRKSARGRQPKKDRDAEESASPTASSRKKRQATASRDRDRDSSVASSTKEEGSAPPTPSSSKEKEKEPATSSSPTGKKGLGVGRGKYKRNSSKGAPEAEEKEEPPKEEEKPVEPPPVVPPVAAAPVPAKSTIEIRLGDKLQVYYPKSEGKTYEAKVIDINDKNGSFLVHYTGWNNRYDEWIDKARVSINLTLRQEQTGEDASKTSHGNLSGPGAKGHGAKQRKGRNSTSTTSTTSASSGTTPTPPQPTTPSTTRSGASKAAAAAAASLSSSPVSGKRRRSTSSEVVQTAPPPKRRRTRQKSGPGTATSHASDSEAETSDSDGRSIKSEKTSDVVEHRRTSRKDSITPTPVTPETKTSGKKGSATATTVEEAKSLSKSEKKKTSAMEIDDDDMSCSSVTSTKSKDTGKIPVSSAAAVDDSKESFSSSSSNSTSGNGQVIDLDQIRSEMKGLDKIMKGSATSTPPTSVSSPAPPTLSAAVGSTPPSEPSKVDIYEFQEDGADDTASVIPPTAPKLKMFSPVARTSSSATTEKTEKGPVIVSASSVEAVAKLGSNSNQELPDKVPIVAIEKMDKDKEKDKSSSKVGSGLREALEASNESTSKPSSLAAKSIASTVSPQSVKEVAKLVPGESIPTVAAASTPTVIATTVTTTPPPPMSVQVTATPLTPASVTLSGATAPPHTQVTTITPSSILNTPLSGLKGKAALSPQGPMIYPHSLGPSTTRAETFSVYELGASSLASPVTSFTPPPPLLTPSSAVVTTSPAMTISTSSIVAATISPATIRRTITPLSTITPSHSPPVLQIQQQKPVMTISSPASTSMSQSPLSTPERPVLTPIVAASVSKIDSHSAPSTTPFRKQELYTHLIQHSPADPSASASIPTISIISAKPSTAEITEDSAPKLSFVPPPQPVQQQPLKIAATIPPPPPVIVKTPLKPVFGPGPVGPPSTDSPKPKKKKIKITTTGWAGTPTPVKTLAPLPTVGAPPPPPVVISSVTLAPTSTTMTPTPGRKTPVKKRIPPPMDSPGKPIKPLGMGLAGPPAKPGKMNPEAMNAAIASVGATNPNPTPTSVAVPTNVITPMSALFHTHQGSPGVLFATSTTTSLANQPPPPPVNLLKSNQPAPIKSSSESIAASIAAVASMGSTVSPKTTTPPTTTTTGKFGMPMKRFMKDDKTPVKDKVFTITSSGLTSSPIAHVSQAPPPPIVIGKTSTGIGGSVDLHQQPPPITIQAKFQPVPHSIPGGTGIGSNPPVTFVKAPPGSSTPGQGTHHIFESSQHLPHHQAHSKANIPKHPVIIIPAAPVVIKPAPFQHQQQQQPQHLQSMIIPKPMQMEGQSISTTQTQQSLQQQPSSVLVTAASSGVVKPMTITVTPTNMQMQQVTNLPPVSIHSFHSSAPPTNLSFNRGNLPAVEFKPVMSISSTSTADLPPSITVTKATSVMKSISPDIVAVSSSSYHSNTKNSSSTVYSTTKQEDRTSFGKEPEIVVKPAPPSAQIIFHTEAKKGIMEPMQVRHQPPLLMQKAEVKDQPDENSLLCEEIIPGSPAAGDIDDKADDDAKDLKREDVTNKTKAENVTQGERGAATPPSSSGGTTPSVGGSGKPVIVLGPKYGEDMLDDDRLGFMLDDRRMPKFDLDDDEDDNKMMEERSVDSPMGPPSEGREVDLQFRDSFSDGGGDHSPPSSPSTGSTISSDDSERRHRSSRMSPTPEGGSSKSKDSDDDDMDSDVGSKSTHLDDADSKHGSTRGSTRIRNQTSRLGRSPSPPMSKRRRAMMRRNKSPEEPRYIGRTIRTSSGRKVTPTGRHGGDSYIEKEKEVKQPPPPPPVNLGKPPKTGRYNFIPNLNGIPDAEQRITLISQAINDLKEQYQKTKNEAASFDRRVKRWKRRVREKERIARQEATKAAS